MLAHVSVFERSVDHDDCSCSNRLALAEISDHDSVTHSVERSLADRDGLVMAKHLFATTL